MKVAALLLNAFVRSVTLALSFPSRDRLTYTLKDPDLFKGSP